MSLGQIVFELTDLGNFAKLCYFICQEHVSSNLNNIMKIESCERLVPSQVGICTRVRERSTYCLRQSMDLGLDGCSGIKFWQEFQVFFNDFEIDKKHWKNVWKLTYALSTLAYFFQTHLFFQRNPMISDILICGNFVAILTNMLLAKEIAWICNFVEAQKSSSC